MIGKFLLTLAKKNGQPGYAISLSGASNEGRGSMYAPGKVLSIVGMTTYRLLDDRLQLHVNAGIRTDERINGYQQTRPYWGVGVESDLVGEHLKMVAEAFAGDPLVPNAPSYEMQTGLRWHESDHLQFDFTVGVAPVLDEQYQRVGGRFDTSVQVGVRILFDAFTREGKFGNPNGAKGMF
jgi:hypothetical protein